jgi:hypothetical protein
MVRGMSSLGEKFRPGEWAAVVSQHLAARFP